MNLKTNIKEIEDKLEDGLQELEDIIEETAEDFEYRITHDRSFAQRFGAGALASLALLGVVAMGEEGVRRVHAVAVPVVGLAMYVHHSTTNESEVARHSERFEIPRRAPVPTGSE